MTDHKQVTINLPVEVDESLARLIEEIWKKGLITEYSCQGGLRESGIDSFNETYILFPNIRHLAIFTCFLDKFKIPYSDNVRELEYGGGGTVRFKPGYTNDICHRLIICDNWDWWFENIIKKANVNDYAKRYKIHESSEKDAKAFRS